jgi:hypothetical protein
VNIEKKEILSKINEQLIFFSKKLIDIQPVLNETSYNLASLRMYIEVDSFVNDLHDLRAILDEKNSLEEMKKAFKSLSEARYQRIKGSCLDYYSAPFEYANQLFFNICMILFQPQDFQSCLAVLCPDIQFELTLTYEAIPDCLRGIALKKAMQQLHITTEKVPAGQGQVLPLEQWQHYIFYKDFYFDLGIFNQMSFRDKCKAYQVLFNQHPEFNEILFKHNLELQALKDALLSFQEKGQLPKEAIQSLIRGLRLGGEQITNVEAVAGDTAFLAFATFNHYLDKLNPEFKAALLNLKTNSGQTIASILEELNNNPCVEGIAGNFLNILENKQNEKVLNALPEYSIEKLKQIKKAYGRAWQLKNYLAEGQRLPPPLVESAFKKLRLSSFEMLIILLIELPPSLYQALFCNIDLNYIHRTEIFASLIKFLQSNIFTTEMIQAIEKALIDNYRRFVSETERAIKIAALYNNVKILACLLSNITVLERFLLLITDNFQYNFFLHDIVKNPDCLRLILECYPKEERFKLLKLKDHNQENLIQAAAGNFKTICMILDLVEPNPELFNLFIEKDVYDESAMTRMADYTFEDLANIIQRLSANAFIFSELRDCLLKFSQHPDYQQLIDNLCIQSLESEIMQLENRTNEYHYYGLFQYFGAYSRTAEIAAARAFLNYLYYPGSPLPEIYHGALSQGCLGQIFKAYTILCEAKDFHLFNQSNEQGYLSA